jgi:hypothetical protein
MLSQSEAHEIEQFYEKKSAQHGKRLDLEELGLCLLLSRLHGAPVTTIATKMLEAKDDMVATSAGRNEFARRPP